MMKCDILLVVILTFLARAQGDTGSWLNWSWSQAKTVSKDAGNALYKGVRDLACLKVMMEEHETTSITSLREGTGC